jgi:hypothetical protein
MSYSARPESKGGCRDQTERAAQWYKSHVIDKDRWYDGHDWHDAPLQVLPDVFKLNDSRTNNNPPEDYGPPPGNYGPPSGSTVPHR